MLIDKLFEEKKIDGIYITNIYNIRFFSGFSGTTGTLFITKSKKYFFTDFRYKEQAIKECAPNGCEVIIIERNSFEKISEFIKKTGVKKIAIEGREVTLSFYKKIEKNLKELEILALEDEIINLRMVKKDYEIANIRKACEIADKAYSEILKEIKTGVTEKEIAAKLEYIMRINGADDKSFDTIVASGYRSAMPHGVASNKKIENEEFVKIDFGCYYNGYVSDMTRTLYFGNNITKKHQEIYNIVFEAQKLGVNAVTAGKKANEIDEVSRNFITNNGYGENFGHGLGHGIGVEIHEMPYISKSFDTILLENMVITIEPGIYIEGFGGVRIEDDVIVKINGHEIINKTSKELLIINAYN